MGPPMSAILTEIFVPYLEHSNPQNPNKTSDHLLLRVCWWHLNHLQSHYTNIHNTLQEFNTVHPKLKFTLETETQNKIKSLDITINKEHDKLKFGFYCKPTTTDTIIYNNSCHPHEHEGLAVNYLISHKNTYQPNMKVKFKRSHH
jgi:hypothetical protein